VAGAADELVKVLNFTTLIEAPGSTVWGAGPGPFDLLVEDVTQSKKLRFCASFSHHKSNKERILQ
jgi:hypothetical protein